MRSQFAAPRKPVPEEFSFTQPMPGYVGAIGTVNQQGQAAGMVQTKTADLSAVPCSNSPQPHFFAASWQGGNVTILQPIASYADTAVGSNNDAGVVVGSSQPACSGGVATIWTKGKGADLNTMINNQGGASLYYAGMINNPGDTLAYGVDNANTNGTLFLLTPCSGGSCHLQGACGEHAREPARLIPGSQRQVPGGFRPYEVRRGLRRSWVDERLGIALPPAVR